jgi:hypothetical protein
MNKIMLLASLAVLSISGNAMALTEAVARNVHVAGQPAGKFTAFYTTNIDGPAGTCLYDVDWASPYGPAGSVMCQVCEQKVLGNTSCLSNRFFDFGTMVNSTAGCMGFDQYGIPQFVSLTLGESKFKPSLNGLAVYQLFPWLPRSIIID